MIAPYPLLFKPILLDKVWGGRRLLTFGKALPDGKHIGESWELADLALTSASGAGGGAAQSVIANGPLAGKTLREATVTWRRDLLGDVALSKEGGFPLLVKFLDARENLSVQVHPSTAYAAAHEGANTKTECWYILAAEPVDGKPAVIYKGIKAGVTREIFAKHIAAGTAVDDLIAVPAIPGECHNLPSGMCHALGAGVLVAEVQTPGDTTFRVFDWGRTGRELHVKQALECIELGPASAASKLGPGKLATRLVHTEFFSVHESLLPAGGVVSMGDGRSGPRVVLVLSGAVSFRAGKEEPVAAEKGATVLVPAAAVTGLHAFARAGTRVLWVTLN